ncbi:hypothetical protein Taro_036240, partial [Colocasia esculenta]|nr:hypothetical protein [Colocasia esculenta]
MRNMIPRKAQTGRTYCFVWNTCGDRASCFHLLRLFIQMIEPELAFADLNDDMACATAYLQYDVAEKDFVQLTYSDAVELLLKAKRKFEFLEASEQQDKSAQLPSRSQHSGTSSTAQTQIGSIFYPCSFTVLDASNMDFLFGLDMLRKHHCIIDLKENVLRVGGGEVSVPFLQEEDISSHFRDEERFSKQASLGQGSVLVQLRKEADLRRCAESSTIAAKDKVLELEEKARHILERSEREKK